MGRQAVPATPARPPRYGIFATLGGSTAIEDGERWQDGIKFLPEQCGQSGATDIECGGGTASLSALTSPSVVENDPFLIYAEDRCSSFGWQARDWQGRANRQLLATRSYQIAKEVWSGAITTAAGLVNVPLTDLSSDRVSDIGTPMAARKALACVEQAIAQCCQGCVGLVHMTPQMLTHLAAFGSVVVLNGNQWMTPNGHLVIPDAGYDGSGPGGTPAGASQWIYGTSMMGLRLTPTYTVPGSQAEIESQMDRATNDMVVRAYQGVLVQWDDCCHVAAEVDVPTCAIGGAS